MDYNRPAPKEMIYLICSWLSWEEILPLRKVSQRMRNILDREDVWKQIFQTYFQNIILVVNQQELMRIKAISWKSKLFNVIKYYPKHLMLVNSQKIQEIPGSFHINPL